MKSEQVEDRADRCGRVLPLYIDYPVRTFRVQAVALVVEIAERFSTQSYDGAWRSVPKTLFDVLVWHLQVHDSRNAVEVFFRRIKVRDASRRGNHEIVFALRRSDYEVLLFVQIALLPYFIEYFLYRLAVFHFP